MPKVLFINGIKDDGIVKVYSILDNNTLQYINEGSCNVYNMLSSDGFEPSLLTLDANPSQDINVSSVDLIFNQISDPDTHKTSLIKTQTICETVLDNIPCINHPKKVMNTSREKLPALLQNIPGIIIPDTIRFSPASALQLAEKIEKSKLSYPILIRRCGDHNAKSLLLLENIQHTQSLDPSYYENECYLTTFIDFSDENNIFAKYRLVVVQGEAFIRHVMYGDHWEIHSQVRKNFMEKNRSYFELEKEILNTFEDKLKPKIQQPVHDIYQALGLEYFGIDCSIDNQGQLIIFEANANMNMLFNPYPKPNAWQAQVDAIKNALITMIKNY